MKNKIKNNHKIIKQFIKKRNLDKILKYVKKQNKICKINEIKKIKKKKYKTFYMKINKLKNNKKILQKKIHIQKSKNIKIKKKLLNEYYEIYSYMNCKKYIKKQNILNKLSRYTLNHKNFESSKREYGFFYKTYTPNFSKYIFNIRDYITDTFFLNQYYMKKKYKKISVINHDFTNKDYIIKKIFHKINNYKKLYLYFYLIYEKNNINNGYLILSCNKKNNISYIFDARYKKNFFRYKQLAKKYQKKYDKNKKNMYKDKQIYFINKSIYLENKEIKLFQYIIQLLKKNNMKEIYINDCNNYFINIKDNKKYDLVNNNYVHFHNIYSNKKYKSWYKKIGFLTKIGFDSFQLKL